MATYDEVFFEIPEEWKKELKIILQKIRFLFPKEDKKTKKEEN